MTIETLKCDFLGIPHTSFVIVVIKSVQLFVDSWKIVIKQTLIKRVIAILMIGILIVFIKIVS